MPKFVLKLTVCRNTKPHVLVVSTPVEDTVLSDQYKSCVISIEGHELPIDLIFHIFRVLMPS